MKEKMLATVALVSLLALPARAQQPAGEIARIYLNTPKQGLEKQFLDGRKKHMEWHRRQNDAWAWLTWEIVTGERAGSYYTGTFGHEWKAFDGRDAFEAADEADAAINLAPYTATSVPMLYRFMSKASRPTGSATPPAFTQLIYFYVKYDGVAEFTRSLERFKEALDKAKWPVRADWYSLVSGGQGPQFVLGIERDSWADFGPTGRSFDMAVAEATSVGEANTLLETFRTNVVKTYSEVLRYRADLSYLPMAK